MKSIYNRLSNGLAFRVAKHLNRMDHMPQQDNISDLINKATEKVSIDAMVGDKLSRLQEIYERSVSTRVTYLGNEELLVKTNLDFYVVVPSYNLDVSIGVVRDGIIEPWTANVVDKILKEGDSYINVGANFGFYTILAAKKVGRKGAVYSIEANPRVFPYLIKSIFYSGYPDIVRPYCFAAWSRAGESMEIEYNPYFIGGGSVVITDVKRCVEYEKTLWKNGNLAALASENGAFAVNVRAMKEIKTGTLDDVVGNDKNVKLLQLDIEGAEAEAIRGGYKVIENNPHIKIVVEWDSGRMQMPAYQDVVSFLSGRGYKFYRIEHKGFKGFGASALLKEITVENLNNTGHCDILATKFLDFECELVT
ncbi:FkbM family methyltransferase [Pseudomonas oryzihabitans]|uniref:FkbM family methyltransferase n=1 Tax=Pseudomonas oryzihabitans TaxID=47885 RepID=UPI0014730382|nr:FkbM family methyltransferase [Pseudomonas oryzihabitans]NMZ65634.1 FkbM family methyltransferase [Pseudomonas oryzihabitans]